MVIGGGILETRAALLWAQKGVAVALCENEDRLEAPPGLVPEPVDTINKSREAVAAVFHRRKRVERMSQYSFVAIALFFFSGRRLDQYREKVQSLQANNRLYAVGS
jgi:hypothetical protein